MNMENFFAEEYLVPTGVVLKEQRISSVLRYACYF